MKQRGATLSSVIVIIFLVGFFTTLIFKIGPHYLDNRIIGGAISQVGESGLEGQSNREIRGKIADFFIINNIRDVNAGQVKIERSKQGVTINLDYEKRIEMFGNVDVVLKFTNRYDGAELTH
ncbi:DUF4845 domain-containing protein [Porticoccaceae bacterium]|jgi:hypothetical protein|nr:DUF4845 domain-containing protein [Porticoccaceae bacterium]MDC1476648.1 DUF4845 domain-containing protein [Porticoccaceae bacterium]|tara:strand:+ start:98 stop:463 length:366 start_codon:yes stop_codon:yes gene_type:complete